MHLIRDWLWWVQWILRVYVLAVIIEFSTVNTWSLCTSCELAFLVSGRGGDKLIYILNSNCICLPQVHLIRDWLWWVQWIPKVCVLAVMSEQVFIQHHFPLPFLFLVSWERFREKFGPKCLLIDPTVLLLIMSCFGRDDVLLNKWLRSSDLWHLMSVTHFWWLWGGGSF